MICPNCKSEYKDGITSCKECKIPFIGIDNQESGDDGELDAIKPVKLTSVANELEANMLLSYLKDYGIACYKKDKNIGGYMNIYMGYSIFGEEIYVDEDNYELAKDLLDSMESSEEPELNYKVPFYKNKTIVARIILIAMVIGLVCSVILNK